MPTPVLVRCAECGSPYCARLVGDEVVLSTEDGNCTCGSETLVKVTDSTPSRGSRTREIACRNCGERLVETANREEVVRPEDDMCPECGRADFRQVSD